MFWLFYSLNLICYLDVYVLYISCPFLSSADSLAAASAAAAAAVAAPSMADVESEAVALRSQLDAHTEAAAAALSALNAAAQHVAALEASLETVRVCGGGVGLRLGLCLCLLCFFSRMLFVLWCASRMFLSSR